MEKKKVSVLLLVVAVVASSLVSLSVFRAEKISAASHPGLKPYSPSALEWAGVELNSYFKNTILAYDNSMLRRTIKLSFVTKSPDTIIVVVVYDPNLRRVSLNKFVDVMKNAVKRYAKKRGFDWMKVEDRTKILRPSKF